MSIRTIRSIQVEVSSYAMTLEHSRTRSAGQLMECTVAPLVACKCRVNMHKKETRVLIGPMVIVHTAPAQLTSQLFLLTLDRMSDECFR